MPLVYNGVQLEFHKIMHLKITISIFYFHNKKNRMKRLKKCTSTCSNCYYFFNSYAQRHVQNLRKRIRTTTLQLDFLFPKYLLFFRNISKISVFPASRHKTFLFFSDASSVLTRSEHFFSQRIFVLMISRVPQLPFTFF